MSEFLPCPFCGSEEIKRQRNAVDLMDPYAPEREYYGLHDEVQCANPKCRMKAWLPIPVWNRRKHSLPEGFVPVEELREILRWKVYGTSMDSRKIYAKDIETLVSKYEAAPK